MNYEEKMNLKDVIMLYDLIDRVMIYVENEESLHYVLPLLLYMKSQVLLMNFNVNKQESTIRYIFKSNRFIILSDKRILNVMIYIKTNERDCKTIY